MRLVLLTALTMCAFAANSVLNRLAVDSSAADPGAFAALRVLAGAVMLAALVLLRGGTIPLGSRRRLVGAGSLTLYMVGFSLAYLSLDAGLGALILFGVVQIGIFAVSAMYKTVQTPRQILGALVAFAGLAWVLWPGAGAEADPFGALCMTLAGAGWAAYTLAGRAEPDALSATAANFVLAFPLTALALVVVNAGWSMTPSGAGLAILSGAVTSGLGYALWYRLVPRLAAPVTATVQLSVPVIALASGLLFLGESVPPALLVGAVVVLGGIALASFPTRRG
ncbi:DMT family transporter [Lutimaribacter marinistellae]|uniref:DMT family transporter n=1 Tax=Lutimaribacter marinistellae TaxID=1820329 RepID=A0ABV7TGL8_9RHOB